MKRSYQQIVLIILMLTLLFFEIVNSKHIFDEGAITIQTTIIGFYIILLTSTLIGQNFFIISNIKLSPPHSTVMGIMIIMLFGHISTFINHLEATTYFFIILNIIFFIYKNSQFININNLTIYIQKKINDPNLLLSIITSFHFIILCFKLKISPPGDLYSHNMYTNIIKYYNGIPKEYFFNAGIQYPFFNAHKGYVIFNASYSIILNIDPIYLSIIIASVISYLICLIIYYTLDKTTHNTINKIVTYAALFIIPEGKLIAPWPSNDLLFGNLVNGTYPQHLSNLIFIFLFSIVILYNQDKIKIKKFIIIISVTTLVIFTASFRSLPYVMILLAFIIYFQYINNKIGIYIKISLFIFISTCYYIIIDTIRSGFIYSYNLQSYKHILTINDLILRKSYTIIYLTFVIYLLLSQHHDKKLSYLNYYIASILILNLISLNKDIFINFFYMTTPDRYYLIPFPLILLMMPLNLESVDLPIKIEYKHQWSIIVLLFILSNSISFSYIINNYSTNWERPLDQDYKSLDFLLNEASSEDLVLNVPNGVGYSVNSFRYQNVVFDRSAIMQNKNSTPVTDFYATRTYACLKMLMTPENYNKTHNVLKKYDVKYILIDSSLRYRNLTTQKRFRLTDYSPQEYLDLFDKNPFIETVFKTERTRVYKIIN